MASSAVMRKDKDEVTIEVLFDSGDNEAARETAVHDAIVSAVNDYDDVLVVAGTSRVEIRIRRG